MRRLLRPVTQPLTLALAASAVLPATLQGLLADPPGFDRAVELPAVHAKIIGFLRRHLLDTSQ